MLPQLDFSHYISQTFWLLVCCIILVIAIKRIFVPRMNAIIQQRDETLTQNKKKVLELKKEKEEIETRIKQLKMNELRTEQEQMNAVQRHNEKSVATQLDAMRCENANVLRQYKKSSEVEMTRLENEHQKTDALIELAVARLGGKS